MEVEKSMLKVDNRLRFLILACSLTGIIWGCSQQANIPTIVSVSELTLSADRLPAAPPRMIYELWAVNQTVTGINLTASDVASLGRFSYENSDTFSGFIDENGTHLSGTFLLSDDLYKFKSLVLSVEVRSNQTTTPSNIMLVDRITGVDDIPIKLNFPLSDKLWDATVRYNMESVSDNERDTADGAGIWFSAYRSILDTIPDTIAWDTTSDSSTIEPILNPSDSTDTINLEELKRSYLSELDSIRLDSVFLDFSRDTIMLGIDTFWHRFINFERVFAADSSYPYRKRDISITYATIFRSVILEIFTQDNFALPDYSTYGFRYKGWVVSPQVLNSATFTPPGYRYNSFSKNWIPGDSGGLITTGTFNRIDEADDANPFTLKLINYADSTNSTFRWPNYPGEDFLDTAALAAAGVQTPIINLMPFANGNTGTVFITLEPTNYDTTTNFPLIVFLGELPSNRDAINKPGFNRTVFINMLNGTATVPGNTVGFPEILVSLFRR